MVYEYLVPLFDKTFLYDVWSCRKGKGLLGGIVRTQSLMRKYPGAFVWRADILKFFDHVNHGILFSFIRRRVHDEKALSLLKEVIGSYSTSCERERERERE